MFKMDSLEKRLLSVLLLVAMALAALAVACSSEGLASSRGATVAASVAGAMGPAGPQGPAGTQGPTGTTGTTGSPGQMGPAGAVSAPGTDAREVEFNTVNGTLSWRYAGEGADTWRGLAPLPAAPPLMTQGAPAMISPSAPSWEVVPLFTVGDRVGDYRPPGVLDRAGAFELDRETVRVLTNHELRPGQGFPYTLANGTTLSGARTSYFDIDKRTLEVKASGLAYDNIVNREGRSLTSAIMDDGDTGDLRRFCASVFVPAGSYGLVDDIYFTGEETTGGQLFALDVANNDLYAVPQAGRAGYESVTLIDTGNPNTIGIVIGDDRQGAPLLFYLGQKNALGDGSFLDHNGLAQGKLYTWVADNGDSTPEDFSNTDESRTGRLVEIDAHNSSAAGTENHDSMGYVSQEIQNALSFGSEELGVTGVGAFHFSRPEDLAVNPTNGSQIVLNSNGRGGLYPSDDWGTVYIIDFDLSQMTANIYIVYSGDDAGNDQFPDNIEWASEGYIYVQEDRSTSNGEFGGASGREASIWHARPRSGIGLGHRPAHAHRRSKPPRHPRRRRGHRPHGPRRLGDQRRH